MGYDVKVRFVCKQCKKCFIRDFALFSEADKCCGQCGVLWCMPAVTPESAAREEAVQTLKGFYEKAIDSNQTFFNNL